MGRYVGLPVESVSPGEIRRNSRSNPGMRRCFIIRSLCGAGGKIVGSITSQAYGHRIGASLGTGHVEDPDGIDDAWPAAMPLEIEVAWKRYPVRAQLQPWHDPKGARLKG